MSNRIAPHPQSWGLPLVAVVLLVTVSCSKPTGPAAVTLKATEFAFTPNTANLKVGQPVQLTIHNDGLLGHDLKSEIPIASLSYQQADNPAEEQAENSQNGELDVDFDVHHNGQVTFTPTKAGTYVFFCDVEGHRAAGMQGTVVVAN